MRVYNKADEAHANWVLPLRKGCTGASLPGTHLSK